MKKRYIAEAISIIILLLTGCGGLDVSKAPMDMDASEADTDTFEASLDASGTEPIDEDELSNTDSAEETLTSLGVDFSNPVRSAFQSFLSGHIFLFESEHIKYWRLDSWLRDTFPTFAAYGELEYVYMDLDGDGVEELLIQYKDSPESYNGVFHYEDGRLYCWQHDEAEGTCRDYPLRDGTMVRQYDTNGTNIYTLFRYQSDGSQVTIAGLFARNELWDEGSTEPCPYYEVNGREVDKREFEEQLKELVTDQRLDSSDWITLFSEP